MVVGGVGVPLSNSRFCERASGLVCTCTILSRRFLFVSIGARGPDGRGKKR